MYFRLLSQSYHLFIHHEKLTGKDICLNSKDTGTLHSSHYLIVFKGNQPSLLTQVEPVWEMKNSPIPERSTVQKADYRRNREEFRCYITTNDLTQLLASSQRPQLKTLGVIISYRKKTKGKISIELNLNYDVNTAELTAAELASSARGR